MKPEINFETAIKELEKIVHHLEQGELSLEEALKQFERGMELSNFCHQALTKAQLRIEELKQESGKANE